jgi:S-adenosyl methyltransferase
VPVSDVPDGRSGDRSPSGGDEEELDPRERFAGKRWFRPQRRRSDPIRKVEHAPTPVDDREPAEIDIAVAHTSRIYDYLLGGTANFAVDREVAHHAFSTYPGGFDGVQADARANRAFLGRVVTWLATEAGIRQFLDIGAGIPAEGNVHEVAQRHAPDASVVYVDNDPIVLAHAHDLLDGTDEGVTSFVAGDFRDPEGLLKTAAATLDFDQPVALMLLGLLHVIPDGDDPHGIVRHLVGELASGSYLAVSQLTTDGAPDDMSVVHDRLDEAMRTSNPPAFRPRTEVTRFFDGLELVRPPKVVRVDRWGIDDPDPTPAGSREFPLYGGVAHKP